MPPEQVPYSPEQVADFVVFFAVAILLGTALLYAVWNRFVDWRDRLITSSESEENDPELEYAPRTATTVPRGVERVATPRNACNEALQVAETATIVALAKLIAESQKKPFQNGTIPQARALEVLFDVKRSSESTSHYQRLRALLLAEIERLNAPTPAFRPLDDRSKPVLTE